MCVCLVCTGVRLVARADSNLAQSQKLSVYISPQTTFLGAGTAQCNGTIVFSKLGEEKILACPANVTARYVTVQMNATNNLALQEFNALLDGKLQACV